MLRLAPIGVALSEESEWTIMLLTSASNQKMAFKTSLPVAFDKTPDLEAAELAQYSEYLPD